MMLMLIQDQLLAASTMLLEDVALQAGKGSSASQALAGSQKNSSKILHLSGPNQPVSIIADWNRNLEDTSTFSSRVIISSS